MVRWFPIGPLLCLALAAQAQPADPAPPPAEPPPEGPALGEPAPAPHEAKEDSPYSPALAASLSALGDRSPVALIRPEAIGTQRDLADVQAAWLAGLSGSGRVVIGPEEVIAKAGARFAASPAGLARVAKRCQAQAVVFVRWIESSEGVELYPLVVSAGGELLLDETYPVADAPAAAQPPDSLAAQPAQPAPEPEDPDDRGAFDAEAPGAPPQVPSPPTAAGSGERSFQARKLTMADRPGGFDVFQAGQPVGELDLARMVGRIDLVARIEDRIDTLDTRRSVGIGLTLGGFAAAGLCLPFFKSGDDGLVAGSVLVGLGAAAGVTGAVLWWLYGDLATRAGGPDPVEHLLTREEAEQAVKAYNGSLRKELGLPPDPDPVGLRWYLGPTRGGLAGGLALTF